MRRISQAGVELIKEFEGLRLKAYICQAGKLTIGYGHTGPDVKAGMVITAQRALELLEADLVRFERDVNSLLKVEVTPGQFDALVAFAFNVGSDIDADDIPEGLGDSTLLKLLNAGKHAAAASEFPKWNKVRKNGVKVESAGLTRRRLCEQALFRGEDWRKAA